MIGGNNKEIMIYNATTKNNTLVQSIAISGNILSSDFSDDGKFLVVGADDDKWHLYSFFCAQCDASYFYNNTSKAC